MISVASGVLSVGVSRCRGAERDPRVDRGSGTTPGRLGVISSASTLAVGTATPAGRVDDTEAVV